MTQQKTPYELLGKEAGIRALACAFYDIMDKTAETEDIRAMHAKNMDDIKEKLFEYLNGWLGGPHLYKQKYGTICLTDAHRTYAIGTAERDQWLLCFELALQRTGASDEVKQMVKEPIFRMADFMVNQRQKKHY